MFQFTHPGRGATTSEHGLTTIWQVSIHAPREGCDCPKDSKVAYRARFNSRTPGGVRPTRSVRAMFAIEFQFTHPGRGATVFALVPPRFVLFQFTHPGRGATARTL